MRYLIKLPAFAAALIAIVITSGPVYAQPAVGQPAPFFALDDIDGKRQAGQLDTQSG